MANEKKDLVLASYNIRYENSGDGNNSWANRREWVRDLIDFHGFDIVGIQEALYPQLEFLTQKRLASIGVGRDDGAKAGEFSAILYDRDKFEVRKSGTFWLSETPETPSKSWDSSLNRICTWGQFRIRGTRREFYFFNTHFDHRGTVAREKSAELILEQIAKIADRKPFVLTGDFNMDPAAAPIRKLASALRDARAVSEMRPYGPPGTWSSFDTQRSIDTIIDYIFVSPDVRVRRYGILPDSWGQRYPSDHLPVVIHASI